MAQLLRRCRRRGGNPGRSALCFPRPEPGWHGRQAMTRFASPLAGYAIAVWVGIQVLRGDADAVGWLVATVFFLMMSAAGNCWDLLREIGDRHRAGATVP